MTGISIELAAQTRETKDAIMKGLTAYNVAQAGSEYADGREVVLAARDAEGQIRGGLLGSTYGGGLFVHLLWVSEELRGRGVGSGLLASAETEARNNGCTVIYLDTFTFQAPGFYAKQGYHQFGVLEGFAGGHARHFFAKRLG